MQQVGTPEQMASYKADLANLQAYQNAVAQQRPTHNWGIDPFGGMSSQMQANLVDKYGTGWNRDAQGNIQSNNGQVGTGFNSNGNISWGGSSGYSSRDNGGGGYSNNNSENSGAGGQTGGDKDGGRY